MIARNAPSVDKMRRFSADILGISIPKNFSGLEDYTKNNKVKSGNPKNKTKY